MYQHITQSLLLNTLICQCDIAIIVSNRQQTEVNIILDGMHTSCPTKRHQSFIDTSETHFRGGKAGWVIANVGLLYIIDVILDLLFHYKEVVNNYVRGGGRELTFFGELRGVQTFWRFTGGGGWNNCFELKMCGLYPCENIDHHGSFFI